MNIEEFLEQKRTMLDMLNGTTTKNSIEEMRDYFSAASMQAIIDMIDEKKSANSRETRKELIARLTETAVISPVSLVDALEFRRDQYDLPKCVFAELLGLTPSNYTEILNGKRKQLPVKAMKRAYSMGVPANVLLGEYE